MLFDFEIAFSNGGDLRGRGFRLDIPGASIDESALARQLVQDMRLLVVSTVRIANARVIEETHKRDVAAAGAAP
ncbi:cyclase [Pseudoxanthomonas daejeonensis]|uniref:cyclase n=1 Tax=Pseudoxanthomonas daejeonensis TaxID=266062 RepID=UPI001F545CB0|nr:cyclase [Pseudoxanthomonas daejeonensis]UNK57643.1 cyclase [Pseudoxanthomonas daejeonensis]